MPLSLGDRVLEEGEGQRAEPSQAGPGKKKKKGKFVADAPQGNLREGIESSQTRFGTTLGSGSGTTNLRAARLYIPAFSGGQ